MKEKAAVIGSGVIGLTTALEAQRAGFDVTIYTEKPHLETTSVKAGAVFEPYKTGDMSVEEMRKFVRTGLRKYDQIIQNNDDAETGIWAHDLYSASNKQINPEEMPFLSEMPSWSLVTAPDVPGQYTSAVLMESVPFIDPRLALPWLASEFERNDGEIKKPYRKIEDLDDFIDEARENVVFNCSGLGARELLKDPEIRSVRGQIVVVSYRPAWDYSILGDDNFYIFPRKTETILGGTAEDGEWEEQTTDTEVNRIFKRAQTVMPDLTQEHITNKYAGLRPFRTSGPRVELEERRGKKHVTNVGFGGSGWTFCYGAAEKAVGLVRPQDYSK